MEGDIATVMRMTERLIGVLIGGMCVYLGYRLFMALPDKTDSSGKIILPGGVDIKLSRIGPGVFFALFGISVVISSHYHAIKTATDESGGEHPTKISFQGVGSAFAASPLTQDNKLAEARTQIVILNNELPDYLNPNLPESERTRLEQTIGYAKRQIMQNVWNPEWGSFSEFETWLHQGSPQPVPKSLREPASIFNLGRTNTP